MKDLDEVLNPAWSPDGNYIAFSGLRGGYNDLFVYDLSAKSLRRAHQRRIRGARSVVVARRTSKSRSAPIASRRSCRRSKPAACGSPFIDVGLGTGARGRRLRRREEHQPAVDAGRPRALLPLRSPGHHEHLPGAGRRRIADAAHERADRRERHHRPEPGALGRRRPRRVQRVRERRLQHLRDRRDQKLAGTQPIDLPIPMRACCRRAQGRGSGLLDAEEPVNRRAGIRRRGAAQPYKAKWASTTRASRRLAWAPIRSAPTRPAASRSCSATSSATTCSRRRRRSRAGSTSSAAACST